MSDKMTPIPFEKLLLRLIREYQENRSLMGVPVSRNTDGDYRNAIGPAAGPHTQLAGNIIAAYAAGATYFELKTVQVLTGEALGITKPCIYAATEVFNTEWSTELSIEEAKSEYIHAYLILKVLIQELELGNPDHFEFIMSVGYDLLGIQSPSIDMFINHMKDASSASAWQEAITVLKSNLSCFKRLTAQDIDRISPCVSETIALSTMHGCHKTEIEQIATYLITEKQLNVYVKLNPTLLGQTQIRSILDTLGYVHIDFDEHIFEVDIDFESACEMITRLQHLGKQHHKSFGVKLTNTFPVRIKRDELSGKTMYLSGAALYPMAIRVAAMLSDYFEGKLPISFSGGAEPKNIRQILETGIKPVTVSSYLLKPGGYKNLKKLAQEADGVNIPSEINLDKLQRLVREVEGDEGYAYKPKLDFPRSDDYTTTCAACNNCVDICPNRANRMVEFNGRKAIVHLDELCNECGACSHYCIKGRDPYLEKLTLYGCEADYTASKNPGVFWNGACHTRNLDMELTAQLQKMEWEALFE